MEPLFEVSLFTFWMLRRRARRNRWKPGVVNQHNVGEIVGLRDELLGLRVLLASPRTGASELAIANIDRRVRELDVFINLRVVTEGQLPGGGFSLDMLHQPVKEAMKEVPPGELQG